MKKLFLITFLFLAFSCGNRPAENEFALYVNLYSDTRDWITVSFDDSVLYSGKYKTGYKGIAHMMFIANLPKDTLEHDFRLEMTYIDTTFRISLKDIDSLMLFNNSFPDFSYRNQENKMYWWED